MSGKVFDLTGSYHAAFLNGVAWNALNLGIVIFLLRKVSVTAKAQGPLAPTRTDERNRSAPRE